MIFNFIKFFFSPRFSASQKSGMIDLMRVFGSYGTAYRTRRWLAKRAVAGVRNQGRVRAWTMLDWKSKSCKTAWTPKSPPGKPQHDKEMIHLVPSQKPDCIICVLVHLSCLFPQQACRNRGEPGELRRAHQQSRKSYSLLPASCFLQIKHLITFSCHFPENKQLLFICPLLLDFPVNLLFLNIQLSSMLKIFLQVFTKCSAS